MRWASLFQQIINILTFISIYEKWKKNQGCHNVTSLHHNNNPQPPAFYFLLFTFYLLPFTFYLLPSTFYLLPFTFYLLPSTFYLLTQPLTINLIVSSLASAF